MARVRKKTGKPSTFSRGRLVTIPAPLTGLTAAINAVFPKPATAVVLENLRPTQTGVKMRGGSVKHATIALGAPVLSLLEYEGSTTTKLFAATETAIYDITSPADPDVIPTPVVTGRTSGNYVYTMFTTSGGTYLIAVNGSNDLLLYNGTTWTAINSGSTPSITGVNTDTLDFVWVYRNRLYFLQKNTLKMYYLPVDSVGGAASVFILSGPLQRGGRGFLGCTWSIDGGDGPDDKCVIITNKGEVAVYEGEYPGGTDWRSSAFYSIGVPVGPKAFMRAGSDVLIATSEGLVSLSVSASKDPSVLSDFSISKEIDSIWKSYVSLRSQYPWEIKKNVANSYAIISMPKTVESPKPTQLVINTTTGAWSVYTGWDAHCMAYLNGVLYYGDQEGRIFTAENGGKDNGTPIYYKYCGTGIGEGGLSNVKFVLLARAIYTGVIPRFDQLSVQSDFKYAFPAPPSASETDLNSLWDVGLWDHAVWGSTGGQQNISSLWVSVSGYGTVLHPQVQLTHFGAIAPDGELISFDVVITDGAAVC